MSQLLKHRSRAATGAATFFVIAGSLALSACVASSATLPDDAVDQHVPIAGSAAACVASPDAVVTSADTQSVDPVSTDQAAKFEAASRAVFEQVREFAPGVIVAVRGPGGTWEQAFGDADLAAREPATTDMHQRIASITKTFVGTLVLQLAAEGKLALDDPIDNYVPHVPNGTRISLRQLITMSSGIPNYSDDESWGLRFLGDPGAPWTADDLLSYTWHMPASFPPGTNMEYSNSNFVLLGLTIEQVEGKPLQQVLEERILEPLELASTSYPTDTAMPAPYLTGYTIAATVTAAASSTPTWLDATEWHPSSAGAAGAMISTVDDLLTWGRALGTGQGLLPEETQRERLRSFSSASLAPGEFYGQALMCRDGWIGHSGNLPGYNSMVRYHPDIDTTIVVAATGLDATGTPPRVVVIEEMTAALAEVAGAPFAAEVIPEELQVQGLIPRL